MNEYVVDVPKQLKPGNYTMKIFIDTKSKLGVLSAKRSVKIVAPTPAKDEKPAQKASCCGDTAMAAL